MTTNDDDYITKNFTFSEFEKSETARRNGISNKIPNQQTREAIRALVLTILQPLRDLVGKPLIINSGYRCAQLNSMIGGKASSQHMKGEAADLLTDTPIKLSKIINKNNLPYDQLILYNGFVHISHKLQGNQRHQMLFDNHKRVVK